MIRTVLAAAVLALLASCAGTPKTESKAETKAVATQPTPTAPTNVAPNAAPGTPPDTILFPSEYGKVEFGHRKHFERVNNDCATCHPKIFPQAREPLNYAKARHRAAEEYKTSCAACHGIAGEAFAAERNCQRCHDLGLPKH
jgi:c(7)-type cytochrome triheme protein